MKNNKKLVVLAGAAALGLVAATGVTSGFAWFAVNSQVTATGLQVSAKTNANYLLINTAAAVAGTPASTVTGSNANTVVYPAARNDSGAAITLDATSIAVGSWYTATVNNRNAANPDGESTVYTSLHSVSVGDDDYFVGYDFYLYLASGSEASLANQTITVTANFNGAHASVKAYVSDGTHNAILATDNASSSVFTPLTLKVPGADPVASDFVHFQVELFIDGTNSDVKSATSIATLAGSGIILTFATANAA